MAAGETVSERHADSTYHRMTNIPIYHDAGSLNERVWTEIVKGEDLGFEVAAIFEFNALDGTGSWISIVFRRARQ